MNRRTIIADLIDDEGIRLKPYYDTKNKLTIGIGRNLTDNGITRVEAHILAQNDVDAVIAELQVRAPVWDTLSPVRKEALVNMAFNMGVPTLLGFVKMWAALREGDFEKAADEAYDSKWRREDVQLSRSSRVIHQIRTGTYP